MSFQSVVKDVVFLAQIKTGSIMQLSMVVTYSCTFLLLKVNQIDSKHIV